MPRQPMVHHLVARGKKNTCEGDVQANVDLDKHYAAYGYNAFCIQTGKSALVLYYLMNSCVQCEVSAIWIIHLAYLAFI